MLLTVMYFPFNRLKQMTVQPGFRSRKRQMSAGPKKILSVRAGKFVPGNNFIASYLNLPVVEPWLPPCWVLLCQATGQYAHTVVPGAIPSGNPWSLRSRGKLPLPVKAAKKYWVEKPHGAADWVKPSVFSSSSLFPGGWNR